jgi:putative NADH-flavin reductase
MSDTPSIELVPMSSQTDSSEQSLPPQETPQETQQESPQETPQEDEVVSDSVESEQEEQQEQQEKQEEEYDSMLGAVGMASILVVGGAILGGLALFMSKPVVMEHPWSRSDYF